MAPESDLLRIFARLAPRDRALLWLAHVEGRSHAEIGAALGLKAISVRVMLFRARAELARRLRRAGVQPCGVFRCVTMTRTTVPSPRSCASWPPSRSLRRPCPIPGSSFGGRAFGSGSRRNSAPPIA